MARFPIEPPHEFESHACGRFVELMLTSGSHFLTHADRGRKDGQYSGWVIAEVVAGGADERRPE